MAAPPVYRRSERALWRRVGDDEVVVFGTGQLLRLRGTGRALWEVLETPLTLEAAAEVLAGAYRASPGVVHTDLVAAMAKLLEHRVVFVVQMQPGT